MVSEGINDNFHLQVSEELACFSHQQQVSGEECKAQMQPWLQQPEMVELKIQMVQM